MTLAGREISLLILVMLQLGDMAVAHMHAARPHARRAPPHYEAEMMHADVSKPTADYYMRHMESGKRQAQTCLPELSNLAAGEFFANPINSLSAQMEPGGKLFLVGDSVIGQVCQLGAPGLCCSSQRPCSGPAAFNSVSSPWEVQLDQLNPYKTQGWQHLFHFRVRGRNDTAANTAYFVAPQVHDDPATVPASVQLVTDFLSEKGTSAKDVLMLGMIGTHYNHGLGVFDKFVQRLIRHVANPFPGRVVIIGYTPQHFSGSGHYSGHAQTCAPDQLPGDIDIPRNSFRRSIFLMNVYRELTHPQSRLVDFNDFLSPLWSCHRSAGDCTHWKDSIIAMKAQLLLNALEKIN